MVIYVMFKFDIFIDRSEDYFDTGIHNYKFTEIGAINLKEHEL